MTRLVVLVVVMLGLLAQPSPAWAAGPPRVDMGALGAALALSGRPAPLQPTEQKWVCGESTLSGGAPQEPPMPQRILDLPAAWQFSRGMGQTVAVIDTGVNRHPRLPALIAGGDYVSGTDGTHDCDVHGTLVAGLIAARPSPDDAFSGIAPDAAILSIRQLSLAFEAKDRQGNEAPGKIKPTGYGTTLTLAAAVVRAVDMGATVINISEVACFPPGMAPDAPLGAAVRYAYERNVVVVAAAGNVDNNGSCKAQNTGVTWGSVQSAASPAWFTPYVLAVAAVDNDGTPSGYSLHGPWMGVAAPGNDIVSLDNKPGGRGVVNGVHTTEGTQPLSGTSFAAPYVAGLAALVKARYPGLTAQQVMHRIRVTSHAPGAGHNSAIGYGMINPLAALTAELSEDTPSDRATVSRALPEPPPPHTPNPLPRRIALIGAIVCAALLALGLAAATPFRAEKRRQLTEDVDY